MNSHRKSIVIGVSILVLVLAGGLSFKLIAFAANQLAGLGAVKSAKARPPTGPAGNLIIRGTGEVQLSGLTLESVDGDTLKATSVIGKETATFTIIADGRTSILNGNASSTLEALPPEAKLVVSGSFQSFGSSLTILAKEIRAFGARPRPSNP